MASSSDSVFTIQPGAADMVNPGVSKSHGSGTGYTGGQQCFRHAPHAPDATVQG